MDLEGVKFQLIPVEYLKPGSIVVMTTDREMTQEGLRRLKMIADASLPEGVSALVLRGVEIPKVLQPEQWGESILQALAAELDLGEEVARRIRDHFVRGAAE